MNISSFSQTTKAFTLIELMVVVAIISILAAVAIPAYNNYTTKSKFSEVIVATAPTKTAISTCAVTGDCISAGNIFLGLASDAGVAGVAGTAGSPSIPAVPGRYTGIPNPMTLVDLENFQYAAMIYNGLTDAQARAYLAQNANGNLALNNDGSDPYLGSDPANASNVCLVATTHGKTFCTSYNTATQTGATGAGGLTTSSAPLAAVANTYGAGASVGSAPAVPAVPAVTAVPAVPAVAGYIVPLPCVGASASCSPPTKYAASVTYDFSGVITATAQSSSGLHAETFVLTPAYSGGRVDWAAAGTCKTRLGGSIC